MLIRTSHFSGMSLFSPGKRSKLCKIVLITGFRPPFFIDSKNSSDLRFRDGFAADSPLQRRAERCYGAGGETSYQGVKR
jgi:hypothetical protein